MLARLRKSMDEKDEGFTLIELLVVIIIIGILAAIAIPIFLNQRKKAVDASMKSDARTVANEEETYYVDNQIYLAVGSTTGTAVVGPDTVTLSNGNTVTVTLGTKTTPASAFCVLVTNPKGTSGSSTTGVAYVSSKGGIQQGVTATCPAASTY
jgi:prepilin-type N-terminal cleavage/methylation domain-containing protein